MILTNSIEKPIVSLDGHGGGENPSIFVGSLRGGLGRIKTSANQRCCHRIDESAGPMTLNERKAMTTNGVLVPSRGGQIAWRSACFGVLLARGAGGCSG